LQLLNLYDHTRAALIAGIERCGFLTCMVPRFSGSAICFFNCSVASLSIFLISSIVISYHRSVQQYNSL
uniref:CASP-like protein n=1 Tax=Brugia timori TaxID=42155 RepID=A0A0R3Q5M7_9BILA